MGADRRWRWRRWAAAAAAAVIVIVSGLVIHRVGTQPQGRVANQQTVESAAAVRELVAASRDLEELLARPSLQSRVMGPQQAALIVALEDQIAEVDAVLASTSSPRPGTDEVVLWSERVRLLAALVQVRGAPASSHEIQHAVLGGAREL